MSTILSERPENRYGMPTADQILINRHYILGYSYYFRQAKWALEIVTPIVPIPKDMKIPKRLNNFRADYRIPEMFRADLDEYKFSGKDRGHLVASANQISTSIQNSETFLLSNMAPQAKNFNRKIWSKLEAAVRVLNDTEEVLETYVISGPIFNFDLKVKTIGNYDDDDVTLPVPHAFFKSILAEYASGRLRMWSFVLPNKSSSQPLSDFLVPTTDVEKFSGLLLWDRLVGTKMEKKKNKVEKMWDF